MIPVAEYAKQTGLPEDAVINKIRDGDLVGKIEKGSWFVDVNPLKNDPTHSARMFPGFTITASGVFKFFFWVHQVLLGLPSVAVGVDLLTSGQAAGIINAIGLLLAWIGGTLVWGLAAIMYRR